MNIGIVGVGGVGGYFGGKIAKYFEDDNENNIYFVARGEHFKKIRED
jgi:2-dehydropantoate 2-reductase